MLGIGFRGRRGLKAPGPTGSITTFSPPAFNSARQNQTGYSIFLSAQMAVVSNPGQNGHIYLSVSPDGTTWTRMGVVACRNNQAVGTGGTSPQPGGPNVAAGGQLAAIVPKGWWYKFETYTVTNYATPTFVVLEWPTFMVL